MSAGPNFVHIRVRRPHFTAIFPSSFVAANQQQSPKSRPPGKCTQNATQNASTARGECRVKVREKCSPDGSPQNGLWERRWENTRKLLAGASLDPTWSKSGPATALPRTGCGKQVGEILENCLRGHLWTQTGQTLAAQHGRNLPPRPGTCSTNAPATSFRAFFGYLRSLFPVVCPAESQVASVFRSFVRYGFSKPGQ